MASNNKLTNLWNMGWLSKTKRNLRDTNLKAQNANKTTLEDKEVEKHKSSELSSGIFAETEQSEPLYISEEGSHKKPTVLCNSIENESLCKDIKQNSENVQKDISDLNIIDVHESDSIQNKTEIPSAKNTSIISGKSSSLTPDNKTEVFVLEETMRKSLEYKQFKDDYTNNLKYNFSELEKTGISTHLANSNAFPSLLFKPSSDTIDLNLTISKDPIILREPNDPSPKQIKGKFSLKNSNFLESTSLKSVLDETDYSITEELEDESGMLKSLCFRNSNLLITNTENISASCGEKYNLKEYFSRNDSKADVMKQLDEKNTLHEPVITYVEECKQTDPNFCGVMEMSRDRLVREWLMKSKDYSPSEEEIVERGNEKLVFIEETSSEETASQDSNSAAGNNCQVLTGNELVDALKTTHVWNECKILDFIDNHNKKLLDYLAYNQVK